VESKKGEGGVSTGTVLIPRLKLAPTRSRKEMKGKGFRKKKGKI